VSIPRLGPFKTAEERRAAIGEAFAIAEAVVIVSAFEAGGYGHQDDDETAKGKP